MCGDDKMEEKERKGGYPWKWTSVAISFKLAKGLSRMMHTSSGYRLREAKRMDVAAPILRPHRQMRETACDLSKCSMTTSTSFCSWKPREM